MIRKAIIDDVSAIVELWETFRTEHDNLIINNNPLVKEHQEVKKEARGLFEKYIIKKIRSDDSEIFLAVIDNNIIGYNLIFLNDTIPIFKLKKTGHIGDLFIKKEFRGKGIASEFKDKSFEWFKNKGIKYASLKVNADNPYAHEIYKKWGFFDYQIEMRKKI